MTDIDQHLPATEAQLFSDIMLHIWDGDSPHHFIVEAAAASAIRNLDRRAENAFEVLALVFTGHQIVDCRMSEGDDPVPLFTVQFEDKSSVIIEARNGIGGSVEVL